VRRLAALSIFAVVHEVSRPTYLNLNKFPKKGVRGFPPRFNFFPTIALKPDSTPLLSRYSLCDAGAVNREFTFRTFHLVGALPE